MTFPVNHKTVFVLDHGVDFSSVCEEFEFDFHKGKSGAPPMPPLSKSLWTSAVESSLEYCRIIWDLFPSNEKHIRFVVSDPIQAHSVNPWTDSASISPGLANVRAPLMTRGQDRESQKYALENGLSCALEALCELTPTQVKHKVKVNRGRIVLLAHFEDEARVVRLLDTFARQMDSAKVGIDPEDPKLMPLDRVELEIVNCRTPSLRSALGTYSFISNLHIQ